MTNDDDSLPKSGKDRARQQGLDRDAYTAPGEGETRREPVFSGFEDEDEYEEPDRDTDYASAYVDDDLEEDFELPEEDDFENDVIDELEDAEDALDSRDDTDPWPTPKERPEDNWDEPLDEDDEFLDTEEDTAEADREWQEEYEEQAAAWPLGLIAVAILAVVLLAAGG